MQGPSHLGQRHMEKQAKTAKDEQAKPRRDPRRKQARCLVIKESQALTRKKKTERPMESQRYRYLTYLDGLCRYGR